MRCLLPSIFLRPVKITGKFTNCLEFSHAVFIIFGYYTVTLHFHIFLLLSVLFSERKNIPPFWRDIFLYGYFLNISSLGA